MGKGSPWMYNNLGPPDIRQQSTNSMVFPTYTNPFGCGFSGNATPPFLQMNSTKVLPPNPKRFFVFDQSGDRTNMFFDSVGYPFPGPSPINPGSALPWSDGTNVSADGGEEMHEDSEEIDALLYSDSDDEQDQEEEASTGHSPIETMTAGSMDEVSSSSPSPAKRKRVDASLTDTASSAAALHWHEKDDSAESSFVRGEYKDDSPAADIDYGSKRVKRERIQETVGVLRRIIPGGRGKDAAEVLDEAIRYLRSLKIKAKALRSGHSVATAS